MVYITIIACEELTSSKKGVVGVYNILQLEMAVVEAKDMGLSL